MIAIVVFLSAGLASASWTSEAQRVPLGSVIPNAMAATYEKYVACLDTQTDWNGVSEPATLKSHVERGIEACRPLRAELVRQADTDLLRDPAYKDQAVRARAVAAAFDTTDRIQHAMGEGRVLFEGD